MTGAAGGGSRATARWTRQSLAQRGVAPERSHLTTADVPGRLHEHHLQPWSYAPDFTPVVQQLLQQHRTGQSLTLAVCGPEADAAQRAFTAIQLAVGFAQHEREVLVVDADPRHPGLCGLIADPHLEGLIDLVRFGRSCRSLLWKPLERGPGLIALGSIPVAGALPFDEETCRSALHRVALHCQIALYVTPFRAEGEIAPLVRACGGIVYAHALDDSLAEAESAGELQALQEQSERVAAVFLFTPVAAVASFEPQAPRDDFAPLPDAAGVESTPPVTAETPAPALDAFAEEPGAAPPLEPVARAEEKPAPLPTATPPEEPQERPKLQAPREAPIAAPPAAAPELAKRQPAAAEPVETAAESLEEPLHVAPELPQREALRSDSAEREEEAARVVTRPPEEAREVRELLQMRDPEFAYDDGGRYSRTPLYLLITLVVLIGGFLGWVLWTQRGIESQVEGQLTETPRIAPGSRMPAGATDPGPSVTPDDVAASQQTRTQPDDAAAQAAAGAQEVEPPPAGTETPETGTPTRTPQPTPKPPATSQRTPPTATTSPSQTQPPPASGVAYSVHVASYRKVEQANQDVANLRERGFEGRAVRTDLGSKGIWYRVFVGSFPSRAEAAEARAEILKLPEYKYAQVRRVERQ
ncbi:MAG: SPOR domain-containing protein [Candidatus Latescibacterota bacterium]|nr:MAG: SPOR domain-containing protein [Candidatus Latescibacterota bacterium]